MNEREVYGNLHYIPIIIFISLPTAIIITLVISIHLDHIGDFPYISDTGTYAPESCIFGQCLNFVSALMFLLAYLRYSQIKEYCKLHSLNGSLMKWNISGIILGVISSFGMSLVGNFQETNVLSVHIIGALLCFGGATIYFWIQTVCSYYLQPLVGSFRLVVIRLILSIFCTILFFSGTVTASLSKKSYKGNNPRKWIKEDGGWELHVISAGSEWIAALTMCLYILSFSKDFKSCQLYRPKIIPYPCSRRKSEILN